MSRSYTEEECTNMVLDYLEMILRYWLHESRAETTGAKMDGLVHSFLTMLDGEAGSMPAFSVRPAPHPDDEEYHRQRGENWWSADVDIAGYLHDRWGQRRKNYLDD